MQRDYSVDAPAVALTAATAEYMIGIITGTQCPIDIIELAVGCDATSAGSLKVELVTATSDGTGTSYTPKPWNGDASLVACATTAKIAYSVAPTGSLTVLRTWDLVTPTGPFAELFPLGRELTIPTSTKLYVRFTTVTVAPNAYCTLVFEE